ncbi:DNA cytosine methyltransferase [Streptomyces stackebrandtii]|uniref:DNA cytosine methyltransferase n=1 Tax=Streptomyces stackebrandtii TaxID=3051177 RepID=UPI0028DCE8A3|nr:DNA cytosine methyltransferase [Streptomyces sp. DSM 40976]
MGPDRAAEVGLVEGVTVRMAANHWPLAADVHNDNHPQADHDCADISQVDPRRYPQTDMIWASPSCTKHSVARSVAADPEDEAAEWSRATVWDVQRFAEVHRYRFGFVENVCEVRKWVSFRT